MTLTFLQWSGPTCGVSKVCLHERTGILQMHRKMTRTKIQGPLCQQSYARKNVFLPKTEKGSRNYLKLVHRPDCADKKTLNTLPSFHSTTISHVHQTPFYLISSAKESAATLWSLPDSDHQSFTTTHHGNLVTATAVILNSLFLGR